MSKLRMYKQTTAPDTPGTNAVVIYFDSSGNLCAKRDDGTVQTLSGAGTLVMGGYTLTVPATGTASLLGTAQTYTADKTFGGNVQVRGHVTDKAWSIDAAASTLTLTQNATFSLASDNTFAGFLVMTEETSGGTAMFILGGGAVVKIGNTAGAFSATKDTATSINVYYYSSQYFIQNTIAGTRTLKVFSVRTRALA